MSEEIKKIEEVAEQDKAPKVPTTEPPVDVPAPVTEEAPKVEEAVAEIAAPAAAEGETATAAAAAPEEKKKSGGVARRFTFNKRWGKHRDAEASTPKEPEAPKDPKEDVLGWIAQQIPQAVHKVRILSK